MRAGTNKTNLIVVIFGQKGTGKTYLANKIAGGMYAAGRRVIAIAPAGGFNFIPGPLITSPDPDRFAGLAGRSAIVNCGDMETARMAIRFAREVGRLWLIIDEIDLFLSPWEYDPDLMNIIRMGRHKEINLVGITQRPASVHKNLTALADRRVIFRITEPNDRDYLKKFVGIDPDLPPRLADRRFFLL